MDRCFNTAQALGLPLLNPITDTKANFEHGANFAVAGATTLSSAVLARHHVRNPATNSSLDVQLQWMNDHFHKFCHNGIFKFYICVTHSIVTAIQLFSTYINFFFFGMTLNFVPFLFV